MIIRYKIIIFSSVLGGFFLMGISANAYVIEFPSYYGLDLKFSGTVTESYSNNIAFANDNEDKQEGFLTMLSLGLDVGYTGKKRSFELSGKMQRQLFLGEKGVKIPYENLTLSFQNSFSDYDKISVVDTFAHAWIPYTFEEEFGRFTGRLDQQTNAFTVNYTKDISKELSINTGYTNRLSWTKSSSLTDTTQNNLNFITTYYYSELTNYSLSYSYTDSESENGRGVSNHKVFAGIERYLTKYLYVNATAGINASTIGETRYINENYSISFGNELMIDDRTTGTIDYRRTVDVLKDRDDIFNNWRATLELKRDILEDVTGNVSFFYGQGEYLSSGDKDELLGASTLLDYIIWEGKKGQMMSGRLGYTYSQLDSNVNSRGYTRSSVDLGILARF